MFSRMYKRQTDRQKERERERERKKERKRKGNIYVCIYNYEDFLSLSENGAFRPDLNCPFYSLHREIDDGAVLFHKKGVLCESLDADN